MQSTERYSDSRCRSPGRRLRSLAKTTDRAVEPPLPHRRRLLHGDAADARVPLSIDDWAEGRAPLRRARTSHRMIATKSPEAQQYFDQGMRFLWASIMMNRHARSHAPRSSIGVRRLLLGRGAHRRSQLQPAGHGARRGRRLRSDALTKHNGPLRARPPRRPCPDRRASQNAIRMRSRSIRAISAPILTAYAQAMKTVAAQFPGDLDVQTLYAESMMNVNAWRLWTPEGKAAPAPRKSLQRSNPFSNAIRPSGCEPLLRSHAGSLHSSRKGSSAASGCAHDAGGRAPGAPCPRTSCSGSVAMKRPAEAKSQGRRRR